MKENPTPVIPIGKKIARIRTLRGIKQTALATTLGITHQAVSKLENSFAIDDENKLQEIANALGVTLEGLKNFNEDAAINNIGNTFQEGSYLINNQFNPIEKIVALYEALIKSEKEKNALLESMLKKTGPVKPADK